MKSRIQIAGALIVGGLACLFLGGCVAPENQSSFATLGDRGEDARGVTSGQNIRLRSGDSIELRLGGVPIEEITQVSGTYTVDTQGFVNAPGAGRVKASGLTQDEFQLAVERAYRQQDVYTNPTVTVSVPLEARFVNVGGEVRLPQRVPYTPDLTVLSAITAAGGLTEYASQARIRLYRGLEFEVVNLKKIRRSPARDIPLEPGDTIEVTRSFF